jgi:predicted RNA-binding Zn ribbon-like protein
VPASAPRLHEEPPQDRFEPGGRFELSAGALCLDFSNTWGDRARPESDRVRGYLDLIAFAAAAGLLGEAEADPLRRRATRHPGEAEAALAGARELRDALYRLFSAHAAGRPAESGDVEAVNAALHEALSRLRLEHRGMGFGWAWQDADGDLAAPLRPIVRSAAELLVSADLERVRECHGAACTWLFLDASRNRSRRWCSMESCGNRAKARRHYHRRRGGEAAAG